MGSLQYGSDDSVAACQALLSFERDLGSLDDLADADRRTKAKLALAADRAAKLTAKETVAAADKKAGAKRPIKRRRENTDDVDGGGKGTGGVGGGAPGRTVRLPSARGRRPTQSRAPPPRRAARTATPTPTLPAGQCRRALWSPTWRRTSAASL